MSRYGVFLWGYAAGIAAVGLFFACSSPSALQCRLDAVSHLPLSVVEDPDSLTVGDVRELASALKECRSPAPGAGDAGP